MPTAGIGPRAAASARSKRYLDSLAPEMSAAMRAAICERAWFAVFRPSRLLEIERFPGSHPRCHRARLPDGAGAAVI
jgi:hypothetical protein